MKNVTLSIDEHTLKQARIYAAEQETTVNGLVRAFLEGLAARVGEASAGERAKIREELAKLGEQSPGRLGEWKWNREDLYAERLSRYEHPGLRRHADRLDAGEDSAGE